MSEPSPQSFAGSAAAAAGASDADATLARWKEEEARVRARLGPPGVAERGRLAGLSGLEFFTAMSSGELAAPGIGATLGFVPIEFEAGRFVFQGTPGAAHYNPLGTVHGGYAATLLDSCLGCAVHTTLPAGRAYTTLELKLNYIRPMTERTGPVRAEGRIVSVTRQIGIAEGQITDAAGKIYAFGTTTCLIFDAAR
jgi:uncharacterized protein (TIGR00369 family)